MNKWVNVKNLRQVSRKPRKSMKFYCLNEKLEFLLFDPTWSYNLKHRDKKKNYESRDFRASINFCSSFNTHTDMSNTYQSLSESSVPVL